jgi:hypothetical protein
VNGKPNQYLKTILWLKAFSIVSIPALNGIPKTIPIEMTNGSRRTMPKLTKKLKTKIGVML